MTEQSKKYARYAIGATLLAAVISAYVSLFIHFDSKTSNKQITKAEQKEFVFPKAVIEDAESISKSIVIWGGESPGVDLGYLNQISGFYSRHKKYFETENEFYKNELIGWQGFFQKRRENERSIYPSDISDLIGLVKSGKDHLESIVEQHAKLNKPFKQDK